MADIPITDTFTTQNFSPTFNWQVGFSDFNSSNQNIPFRVTVRPLHSFETFTRIPSNSIVYEETGVLLDAIDNLGFWEFSIDKNISSSGGPYRNYQVVVEAHDADGNTSAGNRVGQTDEDGWNSYPNGYDIIAVYNPRPSGIELSNNLPTQNLSIGPYLSGNTGYISKQYLDANGNITIQFTSGQFDSDLVGGYIYTSTIPFPKTEIFDTNDTVFYPRVQKTKFDFNPLNPYIHIPTAAFNVRGAPFIYASISFFDEIDNAMIGSGIDISSGLYVSNNAIIFNDNSAGTMTLGGNTVFTVVQTTGYPGVGSARAIQLISSGIEIARTSISGTLNQPGNITTIFYMSAAITGSRYTGFGGGDLNSDNGGIGGETINNVSSIPYGGFSGDVNVMVDFDALRTPQALYKNIRNINKGDTVVTWVFRYLPISLGETYITGVSYDYNIDNWRNSVNITGISLANGLDFVPNVLGMVSGTVDRKEVISVNNYYKLTLTGDNLIGSKSIYLGGEQILGFKNNYRSNLDGYTSGVIFRRVKDAPTGVLILSGPSAAFLFVSGIEQINSPNTLYCLNVKPYQTLLISGSGAFANYIYAHDSVIEPKSIFGV